MKNQIPSITCNELKQILIYSKSVIFEEPGRNKILKQ